MNRFQQRIPNFIEHKPEDRLDITFEDISEWEATDFYKWHIDNPNFDHFEIGRDVWFENTERPIRPLISVWKEGKTFTWCGWFDDPDAVDLPEWVKPDEA